MKTKKPFHIKHFKHLKHLKRLKHITISQELIYLALSMFVLIVIAIILLSPR
ncbi:MAG: hypothetical protein WCO06_02040 [Candidatus Roizmanbacteria bacterium]